MNIKYPAVCPRSVIKVISPIIKGKTVCDLGCGLGYMMGLLLEFGAKKVNGIEDKEGLYWQAVEAGYDVIHGDVIYDELPEADIYWNWMPMPVVIDVIDKIEDAIIITGDLKGQDDKLDKYRGFRLDIPFNERDLDEIFKITIIDKRKI